MSVYRKGLMAELMGRTTTMIQVYTSGDYYAYLSPSEGRHECVQEGVNGGIDG